MRFAKVSSWIAAIALGPVVVTYAAGGGTSGGSSPEPQRSSPAEIARSEYNAGVRQVKQAKKLEESAVSLTDENKKAKSLERATKLYNKARGDFVVAVQNQPKMHEAWNYIGFTSRKLGEYDQALTAYEEALRLNPTYGEAIEYRGETYLGLNRIDDAKAAYMTLFSNSRDLANQLMTAMQQWVAARRADPAGLAASDIDAFAQWVTERAGVAQQTASLAADAGHIPWQ